MVIIIIKAFGDMETLHERIGTYGVDVLSDAEALSGVLSIDVDVCRSLLVRVDGRLNRLRRCSLHELTELHGLTKRQAVRMKSMFALCGRMCAEVDEGRVKVTDSGKGFDLVRWMCHEPVEKFVVLCFNKANVYTGMFEVSSGSACGTVVEPKEVMRELMMRRSEAFIMVHNHPSGNMRPSDADMRLTDKVKNIGVLHGIQLLDHLIVGYDGKECYYSFQNEGKL